MSLVLASLLSNCGYEGPDFVTDNGVAVYDSPYAESEVEAVVTQFLTALHERKNYRYNPFKRDLVRVYFRDELLACPQSPLGCYGTSTSLEMADVFAHTDCLAGTAFAHELAHIARGRVEQDMDYDHQDSMLFGPDGIVEQLKEACHD
jgi:hypothetical protein